MDKLKDLLQRKASKNIKLYGREEITIFLKIEKSNNRRKQKHKNESKMLEVPKKRNNVERGVFNRFLWKIKFKSKNNEGKIFLNRYNVM